MPTRTITDAKVSPVERSRKLATQAYRFGNDCESFLAQSILLLSDAVISLDERLTEATRPLTRADYMAKRAK